MWKEECFKECEEGRELERDEEKRNRGKMKKGMESDMEREE